MDRAVRSEPSASGVEDGSHPLLTPVDVGGLRLRNRTVVAPMSRVSTVGDGVATDAMARYYAEFTLGGFGLVVTEGAYTDVLHSQAYANQPGIVTRQQVEAWSHVVGSVTAGGGALFLQLMHAGALVQGTFQSGGGIAPSAVRPRGRMLGRGYGGEGGFAIPREMSLDDIEQAVSGFADAAVRAREAGFDGVEVHAANGYLFDQFLTPYTNQRTDLYGGTVDNRVRITVEAVEAIHQAVGRGFPVGVRLSQAKVNDPDHRWSSPAEAVAVLDAIARARPAYIHISSESAPWHVGARVEDDSAEVNIGALARALATVPVIANGELEDPDEATEVLVRGEADLIALGRAALANPDWPTRVAEGRAPRPYDRDMLWPEVTLANSQRWKQRRDSQP